MKSKIVIEVDTKKLNQLYEDDSCEEKLDMKEFEKEFHRGVEKTIKQLLESNLQEWFFDCQEELTIEDYDEFSNYGDVNIKFNNEDLTLE